MPLTRFIVELYKEGIYAYLMNGIFSLKRLNCSSKIVTLKISELNEYMNYLKVCEFVTMIENRLK
jgi:hypothetical protein